MSRLLKVLLLLVVLMGLATVSCGVGLFVVSGGQPVDFVQTAFIRFTLAGRQDDLNRPVSPGDTTPVRFTIDPGDRPRVIAQKLTDSNLIADADLFVDYVRVNDIDVQLEAGTYFLSRGQTIPEIAIALTDSRSSQFPFRLLEGWRMEQVAEIINTNPYFGFTGTDFLAVIQAGAPQDPTFAAQVGLPPGASLEGFLFPDTYQIPAVVTPTMLRDILTQQFLEQVGAQLAADAAAQGFTLYQLVTLASVIQREAVHQDEMPMIASIYRNRLREGMRMESDPTVQYAIGYKDGTWWPGITIEDFTLAISPYNTYLNDGLPPGPISNPGLAAIRAAVYPQVSPYYYMHAKCDGSGYHNFAVTYAEHLANVCAITS